MISPYLKSSIGHSLESLGFKNTAKRLFSSISPEATQMLKKHLASGNTLRQMAHSGLGYGIVAGLPSIAAGAAIGAAYDDPWKGARIGALTGMPAALTVGLMKNPPEQLYRLLHG